MVADHEIWACLGKSGQRVRKGKITLQQAGAETDGGCGLHGRRDGEEVRRSIQGLRGKSPTT